MSVHIAFFVWRNNVILNVKWNDIKICTHKHMRRKKQITSKSAKCSQSKWSEKMIQQRGKNRFSSLWNEQKNVWTNWAFIWLGHTWWIICPVTLCAQDTCTPPHFINALMIKFPFHPWASHYTWNPDGMNLNCNSYTSNPSEHLFVGPSQWAHHPFLSRHFPLSTSFSRRNMCRTVGKINEN